MKSVKITVNENIYHNIQSAANEVIVFCTYNKNINLVNVNILKQVKRV